MVSLNVNYIFSTLQLFTRTNCIILVLIKTALKIDYNSLLNYTVAAIIAAQ